MIGIAVLSLIGVTIVVREVVSLYQMPTCSERGPNPQAYTYLKNLNTVSMEIVKSDELCTIIEKADANGKTRCSVEWIDESAGIAWVDVAGTQDCRSSTTNNVFADWDYAKVIVRGRAISDSDFREAVEHPGRAGKYLDGFNLTAEESDRIYSFITAQDTTR